MAMNKKELAAMADLQRELAEARALRFTQKVAPDLPAPAPSSNAKTSGWDFNSYSFALGMRAAERLAQQKGPA